MIDSVQKLLSLIAFEIKAYQVSLIVCMAFYQIFQGKK